MKAGKEWSGGEGGVPPVAVKVLAVQGAASIAAHHPVRIQHLQWKKL